MKPLAWRRVSFQEVLYFHCVWFKIARMHALSIQSCLTLCDPVECSLPGSSVHGILQARVLEWVAMSSARGSSWPRDRTCMSFVSCIGRRVLYHSRRLGSPQTASTAWSSLSMLSSGSMEKGKDRVYHHHTGSVWQLWWMPVGTMSPTICYCCAVAKPYPTLCHPVDCSMPGSATLHYLPEFASPG